MQSFPVSTEDQKKVDEWINRKESRRYGAIGGRFTTYFTPCIDKTILTIKDAIDKDEIVVESQIIFNLELFLDSYGIKIFDEWKKDKPKDENYTFSSTFTTLGVIQNVRDSKNNEECLTDFSDW